MECRYETPLLRRYERRYDTVEKALLENEYDSHINTSLHVNVQVPRAKGGQGPCIPLWCVIGYRRAFLNKILKQKRPSSIDGMPSCW